MLFRPSHFYLMLLICALGKSASAQPGPGFSIPRVTTAPTIDGEIVPAEWSAATQVLLDIETSPGENIPSAITANAFLMEDGETLYVAFIAPDPDPTQIRAFYRDRDSIINDDRVGVILDTFNDQRRAFEFLVNPLGVQYDAIYDDVNDREDDSWNGIWDSAGAIKEDGYHVEMAIPLKQLRFPRNQGLQTWGIGLVRQYPRDRPYRIGNTPVDLNGNCFLCNSELATGFADVEPGRNLEIIPTVTTLISETRDGRGGSWQRDNDDTEASLDIRWGINQDVYLNATINPDFSQVEADSAQLNVNNTFSLFYPERRTFFLDGADYFSTYTNLVHTRNIAAPDYGLKLTGKTGDHSYGLLTAVDESTSFLMPRSLGSSVASLGEVNSDVAIARYRYDMGSNSTIGAIITDRSGSDYSNTVVGIDGVFKLSNQDTLFVQSLHSTSAYPELIQLGFNQQDNLSDNTHIVEYNHFDRRWDWRVQYFDYGADFRADLGFVNRVDYKQVVTTIGHTWRFGSDSFFSRIRVAADYDRTEDQSGLQLEEETEFFVNMNGPYQSFLNGLFGGSETYWNGKYFDEQFNQIVIGFSPTPNLRLSSSFRIEDVVDFANTRLGRSKRYGPNIRYQWGQHLQLDLAHILQQFDVDGGRLFTANLTDARATYQFSARSFLRLSLQYTNNERDQSLYINPVQSHSKELTSQILYSFKLNAASRFFIGYSDAGFQDDSRRSIIHTQRSFFAKFSFAWQP